MSYFIIFICTEHVNEMRE